MLQQAVYSGGTATPTPSPRLQRKTGYSRPVMPGYMTHVHPQILVQRSREKLTEGDITLRDSIPAMSKSVAILCLVLNIVLPGFGTFAAGLSVLCCSQVRPKDDSRRHCIWVNSGVGLLQFVLTFLFLLGWIWSITWGIAFLAVSKQYYYRGHEEHRSKDAEKGRGQAKRPNMTPAAHLRYSPSPSSRASSCNSINRITNFEAGKCGSNDNSPRQARHNHLQHQHHHHHHHHHHHNRDEKTRSSPHTHRGEQRQKERQVSQQSLHQHHNHLSQSHSSLHNSHQDQTELKKNSPKAPHHHYHHNHHQHVKEHPRLHQDDSDDVAVMPALTDNYASDLNTSTVASSSSSSHYTGDNITPNSHAAPLVDTAVTVISVAEANNTTKSAAINDVTRQGEHLEILQPQPHNHQHSLQELKLNEHPPSNTEGNLAPPFIHQPGCSYVNSQNSCDEIPMQPIIALQRVTSQGGQISPGVSPAARAPVLHAPEEKVLQAKTRHQIMLQRKLSDNDLSPFELTNKQLAAIVIHDYPVRTPGTPPNSRSLREETIAELPKV